MQTKTCFTCRRVFNYEPRRGQPTCPDCRKLTPSERFLMRKAAKNECIRCDQPRAGGLYCLEHMVENRERFRKARNSGKRNHGSFTYRAEASTREPDYFTQLTK